MRGVAGRGCWGMTWVSWYLVMGGEGDEVVGLCTGVWGCGLGLLYAPAREVGGFTAECG